MDFQGKLGDVFLEEVCEAGIVGVNLGIFGHIRKTRMQLRGPWLLLSPILSKIKEFFSKENSTWAKQPLLLNIAWTPLAEVSSEPKEPKELIK